MSAVTHHQRTSYICNVTYRLGCESAVSTQVLVELAFYAPHSLSQMGDVATQGAALVLNFLPKIGFYLFDLTSEIGVYGVDLRIQLVNPRIQLVYLLVQVANQGDGECRSSCDDNSY